MNLDQPFNYLGRREKNEMRYLFQNVYQGLNECDLKRYLRASSELETLLSDLGAVINRSGKTGGLNLNLDQRRELGSFLKDISHVLRTSYSDKEWEKRCKCGKKPKTGPLHHHVKILPLLEFD